MISALGVATLVAGGFVGEGSTRARAVANPITFQTPAVVDPIHTYGEPDVGIAPNAGFFASGPWGTGTQHSIWNASVDGGQTFRVVAQGPIPPNSGFGIDSPPGGGDTDIAFDRASKQYFIDLAAAECFRTETTSNAGASNNQNVFGGCGTAGPGADRQWYAVYDPPTGTPNRSAYTGPKPAIYLTYAAAASAVLVAVNSHTQWNFSNATNDPTPGGPGLLFSAATPVGTAGPFGFRGYPAIDQVTGKVFEAGSGAVQLNIGTPKADGTLCFLDVNTAGAYTDTSCPTGTGLISIDSGHSNSSLLGTVLSMDSGRNLWAAWDSGHQIYVSVSPPDNDKWDQWRSVATVPTGLLVSGNLTNDKVQVFPWIQAGGPGRADVVWYGMDKAGDPSVAMGQAWNVFMSQVSIPTNVDGSVQTPVAPTVTEVQVSPHPMHYNDICLSGTGCLTNMPPGNRNLADFFQVKIDSTGAAEVIYDDTSNGLFQPGTEPNGNSNADHAGAALVTLARQNGGPGLLGADVTTSATGIASPSISGISDPIGDALFPVIAGGPLASVNVPGMDLLGSSLSLSGTTLTVSMSVVDLTNQAATATAVGAPNLQYITRWQLGSTIYYAGMADNPAGAGRQFYAGKAQSIDLCSVSGCTPHVQLYPEGVVSSPTSTVTLGSPETGNVNCPAAPSASNPCTITITVNLADVGNPTASSLLEEVGAYSFAAAHPQAELTNAQAQADNTPLEIDGVCCYNFNNVFCVNSCTPEVPWTPALIGIGAALIASLGFRRRRRAGESTIGIDQ
jgi:hypothetical protein